MSSEIHKLELEIESLEIDLNHKKEILKNLKSAKSKNIDLSSYEKKFFSCENYMIWKNCYYIERVFRYNESSDTLEVRGYSIFNSTQMTSLDYQYHWGTFSVPLKNLKEIDKETWGRKIQAAIDILNNTLKL